MRTELMGPLIFCLGCVLIGILASLTMLHNLRRKRSLRERIENRNAARRQEANQHG